MPHLVILYPAKLDLETDMTALCRSLADTMLTVHDEKGEQVFPTGGTRVFAYPAPHTAVADGGAAGRAKNPNMTGVGGKLDAGDYAFVYLNLRMGQGRTAAVQKNAGEVLVAKVREHFAPLFDKRHIGITLQIDVGAEVFNARHSNIHPLFS